MSVVMLCGQQMAVSTMAYLDGSAALVCLGTTPDNRIRLAKLRRYDPRDGGLRHSCARVTTCSAQRN